MYVSYSAKFSRRIIFAVFADWPQIAKIKFHRIRVYTKHPWSTKFTFVSMTKPQKLCVSEIWRYTIYITYIIAW